MNILRAATDPSLSARRQQRPPARWAAVSAGGCLFSSDFTAGGVVHYRLPQPATSR